MSFLLFAAYRLYTVMPRLVKFVDQLTNWYVRMNRKRLKVGFICSSPTHTPTYTHMYTYTYMYTYTLNKTLKHPADYESSYKDLVRNKIFCVEN